MIWQDVLVDRALTDHEIITTLADLFSLTPVEVLLVAEIPLLPIGEHTRILCERTSMLGEFPLMLSIYLRDKRLELLDRSTLLRQFCGKLCCRCFVGDDSPNPYSGILFQAAGPPEHVFLNSEKLDYSDEYIIQR